MTKNDTPKDNTAAKKAPAKKAPAKKVAKTVTTPANVPVTISVASLPKPVASTLSSSPKKKSLLRRFFRKLFRRK